MEFMKVWFWVNFCKGFFVQDDVIWNLEWGFLCYEIMKKKVYKLLCEFISNILMVFIKLMLVLLMSLFFIVQYLVVDFEFFDLVVFDEVLQIFLWDVIGVIVCGCQVVMVGDLKQLFLMNFFDWVELFIDDEDVEGDMEFILDECMGVSLLMFMFDWYYCSCNESLIVFLNFCYYGGCLVIFLLFVIEDRVVSFYYVQGNYVKGGVWMNQVEVKVLVVDVVKCLKFLGFWVLKLIIGVVIFNIEQQKFIEDLFDEEWCKDLGLELYFVEFELELLFVKNLESVQGDECDIMYFFIIFGLDLVGNVLMNFGLMNWIGGEWCLNVVIMWVCYELRVFLILKVEQMDFLKIQVIGVWDFKYFFEFVECGLCVLVEVIFGSFGGFESFFEEVVVGVFVVKGWQFYMQVGVLVFCVDLVVVYFDVLGIYLFGIECDGVIYYCFVIV